MEVGIDGKEGQGELANIQYPISIEPGALIL